ncbi:MAG: aldose 1-epimerase [Rhodoferax sp.]|uniref:aldose 1-epimerase n=1 Tax=Rhodoferax sp. TaxID=50421 RepID=UPI0032659D92
MTPILELRAGELIATLAPAVGGAIASFYSQRGDQQQHWLRPNTAPNPATPWTMASYPLVPYANRIRDGRSSFGPRALNLPANYPDSKHAIHGTAWQQAWQVVSQGSDHATLALDSPAGVWPYSFRAEQRFTLDAQAGLTVVLSVTNTDTVDMPVGVGHHPYVPHRAGTRLTTDVQAMWGGDAEVMPTTLQTPDFLAAMRNGVTLDTLDLDNNFIGWNQQARVDWPDTGTALVMTAQTPFDYFVLYCPKGGEIFCIEPVTNCTDWMNLAQQGQGDVGGQLLAPGATLHTTMGLQPIWPA